VRLIVASRQNKFLGNSVKQLSKSILTALLTSALASTGAYAQDAESAKQKFIEPGVYTTTDEGHTFLIQGDEILEMAPGESGFANEDGLKSIDHMPGFLNWPCSGDAANSRMFATYTIEELTDPNRLKEIVNRYFMVPEVIAPIPKWIDGEYQAHFSTADIIQFSSPEYWYFLNKDRPFLDKKRPTTLLISLFVGTNQVVIDNNALDALIKLHGNEEIPVAFVFNDSNSVPISYFGDNVSMQELFEAYIERGIKVADVPMWWLGDYHLTPTIAEYELFFDLPALADISAEQQAALKADLEKHGFTRKPIIVTLLAESETMIVDQPARVRMAGEAGFTHIPTVIIFVEPDAHLVRCGAGTPAGSSGVSGATTPIGGAIVPPGVPTVPPIEPPASDS
jgi:hypothetical protein